MPNPSQLLQFTQMRIRLATQGALGLVALHSTFEGR